MTFTKSLLAATAAIALTTTAAFADGHAKKAMMENPQVGGADMMADMTIVENASQAPNLTTLVAAVQAADLVETLSGEGPFTVFAPVNDAFAALPEGTVDTLLMEENKEQLQGVLTYHVVPGAIMAADIVSLVKDHGEHVYETVNGASITITMDGEDVVITDGAGNTAKVVTADVKQSNGVVHVIDGVLLPQ